MEKSLAESSKLALTAALITALIATVAAAMPIEDQVCVEYCPYPKHPWIPFWRVAVVMFFSWLVAASLASRKRMLLTWLTLSSAVAMAVCHYLQLALIDYLGNANITLLPFFYIIRSHGGELLYLDLAQVVIVATAAELYFILRRAPHTASDAGRTP